MASDPLTGLDLTFVPATDEPPAVKPPSLASIRRGLAKEAAKPKCPNLAAHTPDPRGYLAWHEWAEEMDKTHRPVRCSGCGLLAIWVRRIGVSAQDEVVALRKLRRRFPGMERR